MKNVDVATMHSFHAMGRDDSLFASLPLQKTSAALVASVVSSFHTSLVLEALEVDERGFDLVFCSQIDLTNPVFELMQEGVRRQKMKAALRSFTMMHSVLTQYAQGQKKHIGPAVDESAKALLDVCEVDSFCCVIKAPHAEVIEPYTDIALIGYRSTKIDGIWLWHIRGCATRDKRSMKHVRALQQASWQSSAEQILAEEKATLFFDQELLCLPKGVQYKQRVCSALSFGSDAWIERSLDPLEVHSDEDLLSHCVLQSKDLQGSVVENVYEKLSVVRPKLYRLPLGVQRSTSLIQHIFSPSRLQAFVDDMIHRFALFSLNYRLRIVASRKKLLTCTLQGIDHSVSASVEKVCVEDYCPKDTAWIFFDAEQKDGRWCSLSALALLPEKEVCVCAVPALCLERWIGLLAEYDTANLRLKSTLQYSF